MKVAYINCLASKKGLLGVEKKVAAQARAVALLGLNMDVFYFGGKCQLQDKRVRLHTQREGFLNRLLSVLHRYSGISRHIDTNQYDLLVLRYSGGDFSLFSSFFRDNAGKIVAEHHTKELPEAYTYETTLPQKAITLLMERFLGPKIIKRCTGLIGVTDEIKEYELDRAGVSIPARTIPNGVLVEDIPFSRHAPYNGEVLNLLFMANSFDSWHGLDRVLAGLLNYSSRKPFLHLKVVGNVSANTLYLASHLHHNIHARVDFPGRLFGPKLEEVFEDTHIAFSSLAVFRNKMKEACTLKTREYTARGLPFVIGHGDPDLEGANEFFLSVTADDSPVNMDEVVAFAERILRAGNVSESMRHYAEIRLDWKIKMQQMWDFLKSLS
ncbi:MAG: glycosyltransferase [Desulfobacterales bacterium]|nr:glycosyltransferase [Desulfobacterales bacterium]